MTDTPDTAPVSKRAREVADALFADLRDRKLLKWLFADAADQACGMGAYGYINAPIDLEAQDEIAEAWRSILARFERDILATRTPQALASEGMKRLKLYAASADLQGAYAIFPRPEQTMLGDLRQALAALAQPAAVGGGGRTSCHRCEANARRSG